MTSSDARPLVLIVDDKTMNLKLARDVLRAAGFRTLEAATGAEALAVAEAHLPDVILMDVRLPDMGGVDAARTLGRGERTARIPVVALSALPLENDADWRRSRGSPAMSRSRSASASFRAGTPLLACRRKADAEPSVERCASTPAHAGGHGWQGRRVVLSSAGLGAGLTRRSV